MKVLVTGATGQLGTDVVHELIKRRYECVGTKINNVNNFQANELGCSLVKMDISNGPDVQRIIGEIKPNAIIHCAAWTDVDGAEDIKNKNSVFMINRDGTENIAKAAAGIDAKMIYISSDYVFDGSGNLPWKPEDKVAPINIYGKSKLEGEIAVKNNLDKFFIVRTSWLFGLMGKNFVNTMLNLSTKNDLLRVVNDQIGTPTYTVDLARLLVDMVESDKYGYYNASNSEIVTGGYISWYDFCVEIFNQVNIKTQVFPVSTAEYGISKAKRPHNSRFDKNKLISEGFIRMPTWDNALKRYLSNIKKFNY